MGKLKLKEICISKKAAEKLIVAYGVNRAFQQPLKKSRG
jgi:hypothetical protein